MSETTPQSPNLPIQRAPRCPPFIDVKSKDDLMPYLESVAKRPYREGALHATWDLQKGEKVLLKADNWHDPLCLEACEEILQRYGCEYEMEVTDRGEMPTLDGHDEVELFISLTTELARDIERWVQMDRDGAYDKVMWGFGGPVLSEANMKITRMPFINPEFLASPAHTIPLELLDAIDDWTDREIKNAVGIRVTDPEGTDLYSPLPDIYFDPSNRRLWNEEELVKWWPHSKGLMQSYVPGHVFGRPCYMHEEPGIDGVNGVIAGTMNHIGPYPHIKMKVENNRIMDIEGGGLFGDKLRKLKDETDHIQYPGYPGPGLLWLWEISIGTNPKIHRPRRNYLSGWVCGVYERMRSGIIHLGFGTVISSTKEIEAVHNDHLVGHWHTHLNFPTLEVETVDGGKVKVIDQGRLCALDDPEVRKVAENLDVDPDYWLEEDWIPAVPGLNCEGSYEQFAKDPTAWTLAELEICSNQHPLFMRMVNADPSPSANGHHHAGCNH